MVCFPLTSSDASRLERTRIISTAALFASAALPIARPSSGRARSHRARVGQACHQVVVDLAHQAGGPLQVAGHLVQAQHDRAQALDLPQQGDHIGVPGLALADGAQHEVWAANGTRHGMEPTLAKAILLYDKVKPAA